MNHPHPPACPPTRPPQWTMCFFLCLRTFRYSHLVPKIFFLWHKFHRSTCTDEHKRSSVWAPDWGATCVRAAGPPCQALMWAQSGAKLNDICVPFCSHSRSVIHRYVNEPGLEPQVKRGCCDNVRVPRCHIQAGWGNTVLLEAELLPPKITGELATSGQTWQPQCETSCL